MRQKLFAANRVVEKAIMADLTVRSSGIKLTTKFNINYSTDIQDYNAAKKPSNYENFGC